MTKSFFEPAVRDALLKRFQSLTSNSKPTWGKMNVCQMLAHCSVAMQVPTGEVTLQKTWMRIFGKFVLNSSLTEKPWRKNLPTAPEFIIQNPGSFEAEKARFLKHFHHLAKGKDVVTVYKHPFFGDMTFEQIGKLFYKHLDHHFTQFGV